MLALCDCNNFFVSCERLVRPELNGRPVVVLSSNDGCIISRSNEVKAMGIPMGEPFFRVERLLAAKQVTVCSGNLRLYKTISDKVMQVLGRHTDELEVYSIDEAFLNFPASVASNPLAYAALIRAQIGRQIGIPVSIGVAATKTLAKLASERAKKKPEGVVVVDPESLPALLAETPVGDVWGIGRKTTALLQSWGVCTAEDFTRKDPAWVKKRLTVRGLMTQAELAGRQCFPIETEAKKPKSIQVSRTWGTPLYTLGDLEKAITDHTLKAGMLLRKDHLLTTRMAVYVRYGYRHHGLCGYLSDEACFEGGIMSDRELIGAALGILRRVYQPDRKYTQGGVVLGFFKDAAFRQRGLFDDQAERARQEKLSLALDEINRRLGGRVIYPALLAGKEKPWKSSQKFLSTGQPNL